MEVYTLKSLYVEPQNSSIFSLLLPFFNKSAIRLHSFKLPSICDQLQLGTGEKYLFFNSNRKLNLYQCTGLLLEKGGEVGLEIG